MNNTLNCKHPYRLKWIYWHDIKKGVNFWYRMMVHYILKNWTSLPWMLIIVRHTYLCDDEVTHKQMLVFENKLGDMYRWCKIIILWNVFLESISFMYFLHITYRIRLFLWYPQFIPLPYCCLEWLLLVRKPPGTYHLCLFVFFEKKSFLPIFNLAKMCPF